MMGNCAAPGRHMKAFAGMLFILMLWVLAPSAKAAIVFENDFDDGDASGWQETIVSGSGGVGSTGVDSHNQSNMAYVYHRGEGSHSLSMDFDYLDDSVLSFDMQPIANIGYNFYGNPLHSNTGVEISFLNFLNSPFGSITIMNATNPNAMPEDYIMVDNAQHNYTGLMSDFAASAGLNGSAAITKLSLNFFATADYHFGGNIYPNGSSSATVWFDNVKIESVPIPPAILLLGSGIMGLFGVMRRQR